MRPVTTVITDKSEKMNQPGGRHTSGVSLGLSGWSEAPHSVRVTRGMVGVTGTSGRGRCSMVENEEDVKWRPDFLRGHRCVGRSACSPPGS